MGTTFQTGTPVSGPYRATVSLLRELVQAGAEVSDDVLNMYIGLANTSVTTWCLAPVPSPPMSDQELATVEGYLAASLFWRSRPGLRSDGAGMVMSNWDIPGEGLAAEFLDRAKIADRSGGIMRMEGQFGGGWNMTYLGGC